MSGMTDETMKTLGKWPCAIVSQCVQATAVMILFRWFVVPTFHVPEIGFLQAMWGTVFVGDLLIRGDRLVPEIEDSIKFTLRCGLTIAVANAVRHFPWMTWGSL